MFFECSFISRIFICLEPALKSINEWFYKFCIPAFIISVNYSFFILWSSNSKPYIWFLFPDDRKAYARKIYLSLHIDLKNQEDYMICKFLFVGGAGLTLTLFKGSVNFYPSACYFFTYPSIFSAIGCASVNPACDNSSAESKRAFLIPLRTSS